MPEPDRIGSDRRAEDLASEDESPPEVASGVRLRAGERERSAVKLTPLWFDAGGTDAFGWLYEPVRRPIKAGVVVCPPIGYELMTSHYALHDLSERLAAAGMGVLRVDYPGTGDAADVNNGLPIDTAWVASVTAATTLLREAGAEVIHGVGLRMGALLLATAAAKEVALDSLVLWDPCRTGRSFLRQQQALGQIALPREDGPGQDRSYEIPGLVFRPADFKRLMALRLDTACLASTARTLLIVRDNTGSAWTVPWRGVGCEVIRVGGQPALLETSSANAVVPISTLTSIEAWLAEGAHKPSNLAVPHRRHSVVTSTGIIERTEFLGETGLFGIVTEPAVEFDGGPLVVFLNAATEPHIGPARQWVVMARLLAEGGLRSVRMDLSGLGYSPCREGERPRRAYAPSAPADIAEVLDELLPDGRDDAVLVGLCSGAHAALTAGRLYSCRGVVALNPVLDVDVDGYYRDGSDLPMAARSEASLDAVASARPAFAAVLLRSRRMKRILLAAPPTAWCVAHYLRLHRSPASGLELVSKRVGWILAVCAPDEALPFESRGRWILNRLRRKGGFELSVIDPLDHGLLLRSGREQVRTLVVRRVLERFGPPASPGSAMTGSAVVEQDRMPENGG
jgi:hypothetical protein